MTKVRVSEAEQSYTDTGFLIWQTIVKFSLLRKVCVCVCGGVGGVEHEQANINFKHVLKTVLCFYACLHISVLGLTTKTEFDMAD